MSCRLYGRSGMFGTLVDQGGNQCALIVTSYSPCQMEMYDFLPSEEECPLVLRVAERHPVVKPTPADRAQAWIESGSRGNRFLILPESE